MYGPRAVKTRVLGGEGLSEGETLTVAADKVVVGGVRKGCHVVRSEMSWLSLQVSQDEHLCCCT
jgi:hypothetical protein